MAKAFQKIYTKITQITKATCSVKATDVGYDELATVEGRLAQVVKIIGDEVTLQILRERKGYLLMPKWFFGQSPIFKSWRPVGRQIFRRLWQSD